MITRLFKVDPVNPDRTILGEAARQLRLGGVVAFPTETVYGLGAHVFNEDAIARVYAIKRRPTTNPLIVHIGRTGQAEQLASEWSPLAAALAEKFWPGPLTLVVPKAADIPDSITAGLPSVAIRSPSHPVAQIILWLAGVPIAAPSANLYQATSATTAQHVIDGLGDAISEVDTVIDGGPCQVGIESTVVSLIGKPTILRQGMIDVHQLREIVPDIALGDGVVEGPAQSPGMAKRHYAPAARMLIGAIPDGEGRIGKLSRGLPREVITEKMVHLMLPDDFKGYVVGMYAALYRFDALKCLRITVDPVPDNAAWAAIRDRLTRAAAEL